MTTVAEIVRAAVPDADVDFIDYVMWARTPYPCARVSPREIYRAASGVSRAAANGLRLCDHCHNIAVSGDWCCASCGKVLRQASGAVAR